MTDGHKSGGGLLLVRARQRHRTVDPIEPSTPVVFRVRVVQLLYLGRRQTQAHPVPSKPARPRRVDGVQKRHVHHRTHCPRVPRRPESRAAGPGVSHTPYRGSWVSPSRPLQSRNVYWHEGESSTRSSLRIPLNNLPRRLVDLPHPLATRACPSTIGPLDLNPDATASFQPAPVNAAGHPAHTLPVSAQHLPGKLGPVHGEQVLKDLPETVNSFTSQGSYLLTFSWAPIQMRSPLPGAEAGPVAARRDLAFRQEGLAVRHRKPIPVSHV